MSQNIINEIKSLLMEYKQYPQGLKAFGINGRRDSDFRYDLYRIDEIICKYSNVLDIGCNCGFLSCLIADKAKHVTGFDTDETMVRISNLSALALGLMNCSFICADFNEYRDGKLYDLVIASQVHYWIKAPYDYFVEKVSMFLRPGGYLLFESHDIETVDKDIEQKVNVFKRNGFDVVRSGEWIEDPGPYWIPPRQHKKIPRKFYVMRYLSSNRTIGSI